MATFSQSLSITASTTSPATNFHTANGRMYDTAGAAYWARGINVPDSEIGSGGSATIANIKSVFPRCNFVRLATYAYRNPSYYQTFLTQAANNNIVVLVENHQNFNADGSSAGQFGSSSGVIFTGSLLSTESNWYASMANNYKSNPFVWFATNNEPSVTNPNNGQTDIALLSQWHLATYNAIRGTGNNTPIAFCVAPEFSWQSMTRSVYAQTTNTHYDWHPYSWQFVDSNGNKTTNTTTIQNVINSYVGELNGFSNKDGPMLVGAWEYGNSTDGQNIDSNGTVGCQMVQQNVGTKLIGAAAWCWLTGLGGDCLLTQLNPPVLQSPYGTQIANWIANAQ